MSQIHLLIYNSQCVNISQNYSRLSVRFLFGSVFLCDPKPTQCPMGTSITWRFGLAGPILDFQFNKRLISRLSAEMPEKSTTLSIYTLAACSISPSKDQLHKFTADLIITFLSDQSGSNFSEDANKYNVHQRWNKSK